MTGVFLKLVGKSMESLNLGPKDRLSLVYFIVDCVGQYLEEGVVLLGRGVAAQHMNRGSEDRRCAQKGAK